ncbi:unnamed protein product [Cochlearia groenlandica]
MVAVVTYFCGFIHNSLPCLRACCPQKRDIQRLSRNSLIAEKGNFTVPSAEGHNLLEFRRTSSRFARFLQSSMGSKPSLIIYVVFLLLCLELETN